jgi:dihydrofolate reductase
MRIAIIVAAGENGVIGRDGTLPWHLPAEMRHFKKTTMGHTVVMGRRTWEEIRKPLPGRRNVVLSRQEGFQAPGAEVLHDLDELAMLTEDRPPIFVIGGAALIAETLPVASDLYLTRVHAEPPGDTFLPPIDFTDWECVAAERHEADEQHAYAFTIEHWRRRGR